MTDDRRYRALSFDCYGTLIDWESGIAAELAPWAERHGIMAGREELLAAFGSGETGVETEHPTMRYPDVLGVVLDRIAARFGTTATAAERERFGSSVARWPAFPDSAEALARLHERCRLVILSNVDRASFAASKDVLQTSSSTSSSRPRTSARTSRSGQLRGAPRGRRWTRRSAATSCCMSPSRCTTTMSRRGRSASVRCGSTAATTAPAATVRRRRPLIQASCHRGATASLMEFADAFCP